MAKPVLPTNYQDDILNASMDGKRRYQEVINTDGTISLVDATQYDQVGSNFGAGQLNAVNSAVNQSADSSKIIDDLDDISALTQNGYIAGGLAVKQLNQHLGGLEFSIVDGKGQYRAVGADAWLPFSSTPPILKINNTGGQANNNNGNVYMYFDVTNFRQLTYTFVGSAIIYSYTEVLSVASVNETSGTLLHHTYTPGTYTVDISSASILLIHDHSYERDHNCWDHYTLDYIWS